MLELIGEMFVGFADDSSNEGYLQHQELIELVEKQWRLRKDLFPSFIDCHTPTAFDCHVAIFSNKVDSNLRHFSFILRLFS